MAESRPPKGEYATDDVHRAVYSRAACIYARKPEGVLYPREESDLAWALAYAGERRVGLTLRGGGSGLAGQSVGEGIVADVSRWMDRILSISPERREAVVQPGVVLGRLNRALAPSGLYFAPDPSSGEFCTLGGMVANNSKGAHAVKYGTTLDHVKALRLMLSDGSTVTVERGAKDWNAYSHPYLREAARLIDGAREELTARWPRTRINASGYNLRACLGPGGSVDLLPLFLGSEGTLAVFLDASLDLSPVPAHRSVTLLMFPDVASAGRAVLQVLQADPSACEILDQTFLRIVRDGLASFPLPVDERAGTLLIVETDGASREEAESAMDDLLRAASPTDLVGALRARTAQEREAVWSFRRAASPLLNKGRGRLKSTRFIEDGVVPPEAIPDYLAGVTEILGSRSIQTVIFGHAGDGNFHVNPFMDLKEAEHFDRLPEIAKEVADLLAGLGGSLSGEHGDGRLRTPYLPVIYGDLTTLFRRVKAALDPEDLLNPGIIAPAAPEPIDRGLRFNPSYKRVSLHGRLGDDRWGMEAERCHGCGTCRDFCPTARATNEDLYSSRGRGHLLQALLAGELEPSEARRREVREIFESCLGCSQCALHCPTGVDVSPLASIFREAYTPAAARLRDRFLASVPSLGRKVGHGPARLVLSAAGFAPVRAANRLLLGLRRDAEVLAMAGDFAFDPSRLYRFEGEGRERVVYFTGCYGNSYDPAGEAEMAVAVLLALGAEVVVPPQACCGVSAMTRGLLDPVARDVVFNRRSFLPWIEKGFTLVGSAPSCLLAMSREQPLFFPGEEADRLARATEGLFTVIRRLLDGGDARLGRVDRRIVYQTPCHGAVLGTWREEVAVLKRIPGIEVADVTEECCGLSGTFGVEARHARLSDGVAEPLMARIRTTSPEAVVTPCGSCRTRVARDSGLPVIHPVALVGEALGVKSPAGF